MSRILICDRCKCEIIEDGDFFKIDIIAAAPKALAGFSTKEKTKMKPMDFCKSCTKEIITYINMPAAESEKVKKTTAKRNIDWNEIQEMRNKGVPTKEISEKTGLSKTYINSNTKAPKTEQIIDYGKAQALRNAGWTITRIAEELGCTKKEINENTVKQEKKRRVYANEWAQHEPDLDPRARYLMGETKGEPKGEPKTEAAGQD